MGVRGQCLCLAQARIIYGNRRILSSQRLARKYVFPYQLHGGLAAGCREATGGMRNYKMQCHRTPRRELANKCRKACKVWLRRNGILPETADCDRLLLMHSSGNFIDPGEPMSHWLWLTAAKWCPAAQRQVRSVFSDCFLPCGGL